MVTLFQSQDFADLYHFSDIASYQCHTLASYTAGERMQHHSSTSRFRQEGFGPRHHFRMDTKIVPNPCEVHALATRAAPHHCSCSSSWCTDTVVMVAVVVVLLMLL